VAAGPRLGPDRRVWPGWVSSDGLDWERIPGWPGIRTGWWPPTLAVGPAAIVTLGSLKPDETGDWIWAVVLGTVRG
jgi:hypothetical protein